MHAHREVEPQPHPVLLQAGAEVVELPTHQRLGHQVEPLLARIHVPGLRRPGACRGRPVAPVPAQPGLRAAEARVAQQLGVHGRGDRHRLRHQRRAHFGVGPRYVQRGRGGGRSVALPEIEDQLRPEEAAHAGVGTGLRPPGVERGSQRQDRHQVAALGLHPAAQRLQVLEVAQRAAALGSQGGQLGADAPALARAGPAPRLDGRGDDGGGLCRARGLDGKAMVAEGEATWRSQRGAPNPERKNLAVFEAKLRIHGTRRRSSDRRDHAVPCHDHGRHAPHLRRSLACPQRLGSVTRLRDPGSHGGADPDQRLGGDDDPPAQAVRVSRVNTQSLGEGPEGLQLVHSPKLVRGAECR